MTFKLKTFGAPVVMLGYRYLKLEPTEEQTKTAFGISLALVMITFLFIYSKIIKAQQTAGKVKVKKKTMSGEEEEEMTFMDYDIAELRKVAQQTMFGAVITLALFWYKGYLQPMVFQALLLPMSTLDHQLFHMYVLGRPATGDLERPWKEENPFAAMMGGQDGEGEQAAEGEGAADAKAIKEDAKGGKKKKEPKKDK